MRLHPPELGALRVEVTFRDGVLAARVDVQTTTAQKAILDNISLLREALTLNGSTLDRIDVQLSDFGKEDAGSHSPQSEGRQSDEQNHEPQQQDEQQKQQQAEESQRDAAPTNQRLDLDQLDIQV